MINLRNMSIGKKLTGGVILLLIVASAMLGTLSYLQSSRALQGQVAEIIPLMAADGARLVNSRLESHIHAMEGVANRNVIRSMDWSLQREAIESEIARLGYLGMGVITPDGNARYPDGSAASLGDRGYFREAMNGNAVFSDIIISRVINQPVSIVAVPIRGDREQVQGVLIARLDGNLLSEITDNIRYGQSGYSYIIDSTGTLIAHGNRDFVMDQRNFITESRTNPEFALLAAMFQRMIRGESGFDEYNFMGSDRFFGYAPIPGTNWSIAVGAQRADVLHALVTMRWNILLVFLVCVMVGMILVALLSRSITNPLKRAIETLSAGASQVSSASGQVASSSQSQAEGASQQASSLEETSSALEEMASQTRQNAENADQAEKAVKETSKMVQGGVLSMDRMSTAISEIKSSAAETSKIIKTIDEIAFQTNLLALNAAVEAARAGEAGKGFAVVAEEVRNLAKRSAEAARNTSELIEKSQENANNGVSVTEEVSTQLLAVQESSNRINTLISEITAASKEQAQGIEQVNIGVAEMDKVVQQNAADSEESASAAEELSSHAAEMERVVAELEVMAGSVGKNGNYREKTEYSGPAKNRNDEYARNERHSSGGSRRQLEKPNKTHEHRDQVIALDDDGFKSY